MTMHWKMPNNLFYNATFTLCVLLTGLAVAGSGASLIFQARLAQGKVANWNVLIVVGCYVALVSPNSQCLSCEYRFCSPCSTGHGSAIHFLESETYELEEVGDYA